MKLSRKRLREIIKEELEVILTDDEAVELFGSAIENSLTEQQPPAPPEPEAAAAPKLTPLGRKTITRSQQATGERERAKAIQKGTTMGDVTGKERAIMVDIEKILTAVAEKDDLNLCKGPLQNVLNVIRKKVKV